MKKLAAFFTVLALILGLCACSATVTWQEQYDLGVRYLSAGNYREAIIAFNAAIEIDPKRADAYIGLADAYEAQGDVEQARQVLEDALAVVAEPNAILSRLDGLEGSTVPTPTPGTTVEPTQEPTSEPTPTLPQTPTPTLTPSVTVKASGDCGDNVTWALDSNGTLTISGTGPMENYFYTDGPMALTSAPWYEDRSSIVKVVVEDGVASVGDGAFMYCSNVTSATIPSSVTSIGFYAFVLCSSLTSVTIPNSVTSIGEFAFGSTGLTSVIIGNSVTSIDYAAFAECTNLATVTIPNSVTSIDASAFDGCDSLANVYYGGSEEQWGQILCNGQDYDTTTHQFISWQRAFSDGGQAYAQLDGAAIYYNS